MSGLSILRKYETNGVCHYIIIETTDYILFKSIRNYAESTIQNYEDIDQSIKFDSGEVAPRFYKESEDE